MTLIPEAVIDLTLNDADPKRAGNRDKAKAPHGLYPCRETDTWVAISVTDDKEWRSLCGTSGHPEWLEWMRQGRQRLETAQEYRCARGRPRKLDSHRHCRRGGGEAAGRGRVGRTGCARRSASRRSAACTRHGSAVTTDRTGRRPAVLGNLGSWQMDSQSAASNRRLPLGEHTHEILTGLLGIDEAEYQRLEAGGVLSCMNETTDGFGKFLGGKRAFRDEVRAFLRREVTPEVWAANRDLSEQGMWTAEFIICSAQPAATSEWLAEEHGGGGRSRFISDLLGRDGVSPGARPRPCDHLHPQRHYGAVWKRSAEFTADHSRVVAVRLPQ